MVEITTRTSGGRLLLRPSDELNRRIKSVIGRALDLYPVSLHAFVFMSNHWHALLSVLDAERLAQFLRHVNGNVAKAVNDLVGWEGPVWAHRTRAITVVDDEAADDRYRYILAHGAKEGLVASPLDWPGVSSARALSLGEPLTGQWRRAAAPGLEERLHTIELTPLPSWTGLSSAQRRARTASMVHDIETANAGRAVIGADLVRRQDPLDRVALERTPAPAAHAASASALSAFVAARRSFLGGYRAAARSLLAASVALVAGFPAGAIPPRPNAAPAGAHVSEPSAPPHPGADAPESRVGDGGLFDGGEKVSPNVRTSAAREFGPARHEMSDVDVVARVGNANEADQHGTMIAGRLLGGGEQVPADGPLRAGRPDHGAHHAVPVEVGRCSDDAFAEPEGHVGDEAGPERCAGTGQCLGALALERRHEPRADRARAGGDDVDLGVAANESGELLMALGAGGHEASEVVLGGIAGNVAKGLDDPGVERVVVGPVDGHWMEYAQDGAESSPERGYRGSQNGAG
jgi:putative transposase